MNNTSLLSPILLPIILFCVNIFFGKQVLMYFILAFIVVATLGLLIFVISYLIKKFQLLSIKKSFPTQVKSFYKLEHELNSLKNILSKYEDNQTEQMFKLKNLVIILDNLYNLLCKKTYLIQYLKISELVKNKLPKIRKQASETFENHYLSDNNQKEQDKKLDELNILCNEIIVVINQVINELVNTEDKK